MLTTKFKFKKGLAAAKKKMRIKAILEIRRRRPGKKCSKPIPQMLSRST